MVLENPYVIGEDDISVLEYGKMPAKPKVSIIVPLYGRIDFVEYQLSQFANDPYFQEKTELIYVLDDPALTDDLLRLVQGLYPVFEIPFKVVTYAENYGYAIANNIGARYATAEKLLLLNSDIMPLEKGWLPEMLKESKNLKNVGALGPKLLFEDGSVQHAGMAFEKSEVFGMWLNEHPGKGLPDMQKEKTIREVPAVTAACLLLDRSLYEEVGGLSENYLLGDFEDSDLCLKLIEKGKKNYYLPTVSLCHLERQSQNLFSDTSWKTKITLFNGWQHNIKWNELITTLMEKK
jgi:GT2 family glycosyltransferase